MMYAYVTVHAKTSLVRTKIEIHFLSPAYVYVYVTELDRLLICPGKITIN